MRVDYYLLDQSAPQAIIQYACRLLNKAYEAGLRVFVLADSPEQCVAINQQLWRLSDTSFVPHAMAGSDEAATRLNKICIGSTLADAAGFDFLLSLKNEEKPQGEHYARIAELVSSDEAHKRSARRRYAVWRDSGAELTLHNIQIH